MKQRLVVAALLLATALAFLVSGQAQAQTAPSISVSPASGCVGSPATVTGQNFPVGTTVQVNFDKTNIGSRNTGRTGSFSLPFNVPSVVNGAYSISAVMPTGAGPSTRFTVVSCATTTTTRPTTTTTTTLLATTTTATTLPATTTTATTQPGQTTTTRPGATTTTQPADTIPESTTTTAPPPTTPTGKPIVLKLDQPATPPGGDDQATGEGCEPNVPVTLVIEGQQVGTGSSDADGHFSSHIDVPNLPVGEYDVFAQCGRLLTTKIDLVLPSTLGPPSGTLMVVFFFLLFGFALVRRQIAGDLAGRHDRKV